MTWSRKLSVREFQSFPEQHATLDTGWTLWTACCSGSMLRSTSVFTLTAWLLDTCQLYAAPYRLSSIPGRRHLRSAESGQLDFPRLRLTTWHIRWPSIRVYVGPSIRNSFLPLRQFTLFVFFSVSFINIYFLILLARTHTARWRFFKGRLKMQDLTLTDQVAGVDIDGPDIDGPQTDN